MNAFGTAGKASGFDGGIDSSTATKDVWNEAIEYVFPSRMMLAFTVRARRSVSLGLLSVLVRACCPSSRSWTILRAASV
jgi:hypothetical protein